MSALNKTTGGPSQGVDLCRDSGGFLAALATGSAALLAAVNTVNASVLATNAALAAIDTLLTASNALWANYLARFPTSLGQKTKAASLPVTLASDEDTVNVAVADGSDIAEGSTTDAAVVTDTNGTISGKLRGLVKWAFERMPTSLGQKTKAASLPVTLASDEDELEVTLNSEVVEVKSFSGVLEAGLTEIIGDAERVDQDEYCSATSVNLGSAMSGVIESFLLVTSKAGAGQILRPDGILYIFDDNPSISYGDTSMSAAAWASLIGQIQVANGEWSYDANGGAWYTPIDPIAFHPLSILYFVFKLTSATSFNDNAGDDEKMHFNFWYKRES